MSDKVCVGVDWTDLQPRMCMAIGGLVQVLEASAQLGRLSVFFDPHANISSLGVGFPGVLERISRPEPVQFGGARMTLEEVVRNSLVDMRDHLSKVGSPPPTHVSIAVPVTLSERNRQVLVTCMRDAGFSGYSLVDAGAAAAVGFQPSPEEARTDLVIHAGYGDTEVLLVRSARGRTRVVATTVIPESSGQLVEASIMEAIVLALRKHRTVLGLKRFTSSQWLDFQGLAQTARQDLAQLAVRPIALPSTLLPNNEAVELRMDPIAFAERLRPSLEATLDGARALLEQEEIELRHIDAVLLTGPLARSRVYSSFVAHQVPDRTWTSDRATVARGALLHACREAQVEEPATEGSDPDLARVDPHLSEFVSVRSDAGSARDLVSVTVRQPTPESPGQSPSQAEPPSSSNGSSVDEIRRLFESGRVQEAGRALDQLSRELEALRSEIVGHQPGGTHTRLDEAFRLIEHGEPGIAVNVSHQAYQEMPGDPSALAGMMRVHCEAALSMRRPEQYVEAIRVLNCALAHDRTDKSVHKALAQRHYMHAAALKERNNTDKAYEVLQLALEHDPVHDKANELLSMLKTS